MVPSSMLDLLSYILCHRFSSPSWVRHLSGHIPTHTSTATGSQPWGDAVVELETGEALLFSPNALCADGNGEIIKLGNGYIQLFTRPRITRDGGQSILAVGAIEDSSDDTTGSGSSSPWNSP